MTNGEKRTKARELATAHMALVVLATFCVALLSRPATAGAAEANPAYEQAVSQLNGIAAEYDALAAQQDDTLSSLEEVRAQIADNESQMDDVRKNIEASKEKLAAQQEVLAQQVAADYKNGSVSLLSILLSSSSWEDLTSKVYYYNAICQSEMAAIDSVNSARKALEGEKDKLAKLRDELDAQEADIAQLYEQQQAQADEMYARQLEVAALVESLPKEIQETLDDDAEEFVNESQAAIHAEELRAEEEGETAASPATPAQQESTSSANQGSTTTTTPQKTETKKPETKQPAQPAPQPESTPQPEPPASTASNGKLQKLLDTAYATGPTRLDWGCSGWVYTVFKNAGISKYSGSAASFYSNWCYSSDRSQLMPGMVIAVNNTGGSAAGRMYGHVGIYMGNGVVRHFTKGAVSDVSLDKWCKTYGRVCTVRWGWNGGVALS